MSPGSSQDKETDRQPQALMQIMQTLWAAAASDETVDQWGPVPVYVGQAGTRSATQPS